MRKIIHIDCDCFYAALEMRDDPSLRGKALAVGGSPDKRGVVATCSYEARAYGVRSAMAMRTALKLCPDLLVVRPRFDVYRAVSKQIHAIFRDYTDLIEPLSLDEAYLDVSASPHFAGSATRIAQDIRRRVAEELHITVSAGVAPNKFLAKIASDWRKPDGLFVITPEQVDGFVAELPVA
ncbi:DNA polymerase IV, partial [Pseudomonas aeruginosa]